MRGYDVEPIDFNIIPRQERALHARAALLITTRATSRSSRRAAGSRSLIGDVALSAARQRLRLSRSSSSRASRWWSLPGGTCSRLELFGGAITGNAPFFEKFYVGDFTDLLPDRVLDLNFDRRPPPNFSGTDIVEVRYGDYAAKIAGRVPHPALPRAPLDLRHRSLRRGRRLRRRERPRHLPIRRAATTGFARFPSISRSTSGFAPTPTPAASSSRSRTCSASCRSPAGANRDGARSVRLRSSLRSRLSFRGGRETRHELRRGRLRVPRRQANVSPGTSARPCAWRQLSRRRRRRRRTKLTSGLPTTIVMRAYVFRERAATPVAAPRSGRAASSYDLWDEVYRIEISQTGQAETVRPRPPSRASSVAAPRPTSSRWPTRAFSYRKRAYYSPPSSRSTPCPRRCSSRSSAG